MFIDINSEIIKAHRHSINHFKEIMESEICGCFDCLAIFKPIDIKEWIEDERKTAVCPFCINDTVIGSKSGYPMNKKFLKAMRNYWCSEEE